MYIKNKPGQKLTSQTSLFLKKDKKRFKKTRLVKLIKLIKLKA